MNKLRFHFSALVFILFSSTSYSLDAEIDPIAFFLDGYSYHIGFGAKSSRLELGVYEMEISESIHGEKNYELSFEGVGIKLDHLFGKYAGTFIGWEVNYANVKYTHTPTQRVLKRKLITTAPRLGYRFIIYDSITITPVLAFDILVEDGKEVKVNEDEFDNKNYQFVPSIHLGYKF